MKSFKLLAVGALAVSAMVPAFAADYVVYVTGATAFRNSTNAAIQSLYSSGQFGWAGTATNLNGANQAIFKGTLAADIVDPSGNGWGTISASSDTLTVVTSFSGSAAGLQAIVQTPALTLNYINPTTTPAGVGGLSASHAHAADIAFSDVRLEMTPFTRETDLFPFEAENSPLGVVPFVWVKNNGASASITNVTNQIVKAAGSDTLKLSYFTGATSGADLTTAVRIVGRNPDSGTRLTAYEEAGVTSSGVGAVKQFIPTGGTTAATSTTAGAGDITGFNLFPADTVLGISFAAGLSGYNSGSVLRDVLKRTSSAGPVIAYLSWGDATNAAGGGAVILSYNGVGPVGVDNTAKLADLTTKIQTGQYSFWSYEHLYYNGNEVGANIVAEKLASLLRAAPGSDGIALGSMKVQRAVEGAPITPNY